MTLLYLDTSALFKRYVEEAESEALLGRIVFACFDNDPRRAGAAEGLETWPA